MSNDPQAPIADPVKPNPEPDPHSPDGRDTPPPLSLFVKGFCMGSADVVPGVSGGTMAFILGIYTQLIDAIRSFDLHWLKAWARLDLATITGRPHFRFVLPLLAGIVAALLFFTRIIPLPYLIVHYPEQVYGLFFGLIAGSCVVLTGKIGRLQPMDYMVMLAGLVPGLLVFNLGTMALPDTTPYVFMAGCLAISAMLLPGISGSFILLILGKYAYIFSAIGYLDLAVIGPFVLGMLTGLVLFSRILSWVLHHYYRATTLVITGLLLASLWVIWPFQLRVYTEVAGKTRLSSTSPIWPGDFDLAVSGSILLMLTGFIMILVMDWIARKKKNTA